MSGTSIYSNDERRSWVCRWRESGLSKKDFAKIHDLPYGSLKYWVMSVMGQTTVKRTDSELEDKVIHSDESFVSLKIDNDYSDTLTGQPIMELQLSNGGMLRFYQPVSADYIRELLK